MGKEVRDGSCAKLAYVTDTQKRMIQRDRLCLCAISYRQMTAVRITILYALCKLNNERGLSRNNIIEEN
jgi:hypothetical protein